MNFIARTKIKTATGNIDTSHTSPCELHKDFYAHQIHDMGIQLSHQMPLPLSYMEES